MTVKNYLLSYKLLQKIKIGSRSFFHGGVHPTENKQQSSQHSIEDAGISPYLIFSIEHKGHIAESLVKVGDLVLKGQALTKVCGSTVAQHASSSGKVISIEPRTDLHPSGLAVMSIVIESDGLDRTINYQTCPDFLDKSRELIISETQKAGIIGLGGAGFPTHVKLSRASSIRLLIINGAECEPYITSDDRLMQEHAQEIIKGIDIARHTLKPDVTIIAIEDNKQDAISALQKVLDKYKRTNIIVRSIPVLYPSGSAKQLIKILTGKETPIGKHANELGIVMLNVGTVFAMKEAIMDGKPLVSRIVTLTGNAFERKGNFSVRLGTPIQYLLDKYGFKTQSHQKLIIGGPMMGFSLAHADVPVTKICNCILAPSTEEMPNQPAEMPCIRCSDCAKACPTNLLPQQLLWYSQSKDYDKLNEYDLSACIECGNCAYVCPSSIPLVEYYRIAKSEMWTAKQEAKKTEVARLRHENREKRLAQAKIDRQEKHKEAAEKRKQQLKEKNGDEDLIAAALARAKAKKLNAQKQTDEKVDEVIEPKEKEATSPDPRKNAVAAAVARAKAKKLNAQKQTDEKVDEVIKPKKEVTTSPDPRKNAVAAAVARAKAKKLNAQKQTDEKVDEVIEPQKEVTTSPDPRKNAVAAAVARAKAKKLNAQKQTDEKVDEVIEPKKEVTTSPDPKKEISEKTNEMTKEEDDSQTESARRKAAVATVIAKAKARKAQKESEQKTQQMEKD